MSVIEKISRMSNSGCHDALLNYTCEKYDEIQCEYNDDEYKQPKKHNSNFCIDCNLKVSIDSQKSILVSLTVVYMSTIQYNHMMKLLRSRCIYKISDNFKVILNKFFYGGTQLVPDDVMNAIRNEIHNGDNILYYYKRPLTIPILECILKGNKITKYKIVYITSSLN